MKIICGYLGKWSFHLLYANHFPLFFFPFELCEMIATKYVRDIFVFRAGILVRFATFLN